MRHFLTQYNIRMDGDRILPYKLVVEFLNTSKGRLTSLTLLRGTIIYLQPVHLHTSAELDRTTNLATGNKKFHFL